MITVGHNVDEVINYVQEEFKKNPELQAKHPGILAELYDLKTFPDYDSIESYRKFIRGYFFGHEEILAVERLFNFKNKFEPLIKVLAISNRGSNQRAIESQSFMFFS